MNRHVKKQLAPCTLDHLELDLRTTVSQLVNQGFACTWVVDGAGG